MTAFIWNMRGSSRTPKLPGFGARVTQRNDSFDGAALVTRDEGGGTVNLPTPYTTNYAVQDYKSLATFARGRWQAGGATVGALFTDRTLDNHSYNRVFGPDIANELMEGSLQAPDGVGPRDSDSPFDFSNQSTG